MEVYKDKALYNDLRINESKIRWIKKTMHVQLHKDAYRINREERWLGMTKQDLKMETEAIICAAKEQALITNNIKNRLNMKSQIVKCRICGQNFTSESTRFSSVSNVKDV